jgi:hypothetical protein
MKNWNKVAWAIYLLASFCSCSDGKMIECHPINEYLVVKLNCCLEENVISIFAESEWRERHNLNEGERMKFALPPPPPTFGIAIIGEGEIASLNEKGYDFDVELLDQIQHSEDSKRIKWKSECISHQQEDCCTLRTSKPIYSKSGNYILVYAHTREYGWRFVYKFNKEEGEWMVVDEQMIWIT